MEKGIIKHKLIIQEFYPNSIIVSEIVLTESELTEVLRYLNWLRTAKFGTFEAVKYKHASEYIDVAITNRNRNTLYLLQNEE